MRALLAVLVLAAMAWTFPTADNNSGFGDTSNIAKFNADSLKYSKWYQLSSFENMAAIVMANDTAHAGFKADSVKFIWGIQYGDPVLNFSGKRDTCFRKACIIDTFSSTAADTVYLNPTTYGYFDSTGTQCLGLRQIDTVQVTGFMTQNRSVTPEWHSYFRFFAKGLTGNTTRGFVQLWFAPVRRQYIPVRNQ